MLPRRTQAGERYDSDANISPEENSYQRPEPEYGQMLPDADASASVNDHSSPADDYVSPTAAPANGPVDQYGQSTVVDVNALQKVGLPSHDDESAEATVDSRGSTLKWILVLLGVIVLALVLIGGIWAAQNQNGIKFFNKSSIGSSGISSSGGTGGVSDVSNSTTFMDTLGIPQYYQQPNTKMSDADKAKANQEALASAPDNLASSLPSKSSNPNLTDDLSKTYNKDRSINPNFSYITLDNTMPVIQDDIERLVNPVYGQWTGMQSPSGTDMYESSAGDPWMNLRDMFSPRVWSTFTNADAFHKSVNIYADWNKDFYGGTYKARLLSDPIVGSVEDYNCASSVNGMSDDKIECTVLVRYSSKLNGQVFTEDKDKKMKLTYKINYDEQAQSNRRILLTSVSQE